jgi:hypothetical protein
MRWIALLSIIIICGCGDSNPPQQKTAVVSGSEKGEAKSMVPVVVEAKIVGGGDGSKYYWYDVKPIKIIKNTIAAKLDSPIKVAIQNDMPEVEVGKTYILDLVYYNEAHPEYGLKILSFKEK